MISTEGKINPKTDFEEVIRGLMILISITVVLLILSIIISSDEKNEEQVSQQKTANENGESNFLLAFAGDFWLILDNNVAVNIQPKIYVNLSQFNLNLVAIIGNGTLVEILESRGILSPWKRVYIYDSNKQIIGEGWILAEVVKRATRIKKGLLSPL